MDLLDADDVTPTHSTGAAQPAQTTGAAQPTVTDPKADEAPHRRLGRRGPKHAAPEAEAATTGKDDPGLAKYLAAPATATDDDTEEEKGKAARADKRGSRNRRLRSGLVRGLIVLLVAAVVAVLLRAFVVEPYYIPSESMEPTLHGCAGCTDDHVLVDKISYRFQSVHAGDIVVFDKPPNANVADKVLIKRVIALSGDTVQLRRNSAGQWDGKVYVNGLALDESYVNKACPAPQTVPLTATTSWKIPDKEVFVMGDNRCRSDDSRAFGPIKTSSIIGRAVLIVWPLSRFGGI